MLTDQEYQAYLTNLKPRPARATCPLCHGRGYVADPDGRCAPEPCLCALAAADADRRTNDRLDFLRAIRR